MTGSKHVLRPSPAGLLAGLIGILTANAVAIIAPTTDRFLEAARGLSTSVDASPLIEARSRAHLDAMGAAEVDLIVGLQACPDERTRLAYLDARLAAPGMPFDPELASEQALAALRATHPEDRMVLVDDRIRRLRAEEGVPGAIPALEPADLIWRPFIWTPDTPADLIAALSAEHRQALLRSSRPGDLPSVIAAVLAATDGRPTDETAALIEWDSVKQPGLWSAVLRELDRRRAGTAIVNLLQDRPALLELPEHRVLATIAVARIRPEFALDLVGGEANLTRLPASVRGLIRAALAEGRRDDADPEVWRTEVALIDGLDARLRSMLSLERVRDDASDPDRTLESITSLRTLGPGRLAADLATGRSSAGAIVRALTDLLITGRYELAYSFLAPNTTEPDRAGDPWLPARITLLSRALMEADAAADAWIPLIESVRRLKRLDAQLAALRAIAVTYGRRHDLDSLPPDVRGTLDDTLLEIAIRD